MSSELAMNAYVLLGNTLHCVLNKAPAAVEERLGASPGALSELNQILEPLPPARILDGIAALTTGQRDLLAGAVRLCLSTLSSEGAGNLLGLPVEVANETLVRLGLDGQ